MRTMASELKTSHDRPSTAVDSAVIMRAMSLAWVSIPPVIAKTSPSHSSCLTMEARSMVRNSSSLTRSS